MAKQIEVVVIHGSHKHHDGLDDKGKPINAPVVKGVGESLVMSLAELKAVDPQFSLKKGIGERFATPKAAEKLNLKRQLEEELESSEEDEPEDEENVEEAPAPEIEAAAKPKKGKKKAEG